MFNSPVWHQWDRSKLNAFSEFASRRDFIKGFEGSREDGMICFTDVRFVLVKKKTCQYSAIAPLLLYKGRPLTAKFFKGEE